jgi:hypothetical protein
MMERSIEAGVTARAGRYGRNMAPDDINFHSVRERDFHGNRERDFHGNRERDFHGNRERDFHGNRERGP